MSTGAALPGACGRAGAERPTRMSRRRRADGPRRSAPPAELCGRQRGKRAHLGTGAKASFFSQRTVVRDASGIRIGGKARKRKGYLTAEPVAMRYGWRGLSEPHYKGAQRIVQERPEWTPLTIEVDGRRVPDPTDQGRQSAQIAEAYAAFHAMALGDGPPDKATEEVARYVGKVGDRSAVELRKAEAVKVASQASVAAFIAAARAKWCDHGAECRCKRARVAWWHIQALLAFGAAHGVAYKPVRPAGAETPDPTFVRAPGVFALKRAENKAARSAEKPQPHAYKMKPEEFAEWSARVGLRPS